MQALKALEDLGMKHVENTGETLHADVYTALKAALEQPEQEQAPDRRALQAAGDHPAPCARHCEAKAYEIEIRSMKAALRKALEQPEQGPDDGFDIDGLKDAAYALEAILQRAGEGATVGHVIALLENLAQPEQVVDCPRCGHVCSQRPWVGLTDEEIEKACVPLGAAMLSFTEVARAIEAKLKERNT
jgi:hypothetical protein